MMKKINPTIVALLSILTLGVYGVIYFQTFASESRLTGKVNVKQSYRLNIILFALSILSCAALILFTFKSNTELTIAFAVSLALIRVADAIVLGVNFNSILAQICDYFKVEYKNRTAVFILLSIVLPFITLAVVQTIFNKVEDKARTIESGKAKI